MHNHILTIGLANLKPRQFLEILSNEGISVVADVRQFPVSRQNPAFNRSVFSKSLESMGIDYHYLGNGLGNIPAEILDSDINPIAHDANAPQIRAFGQDFHKLLSLLHGRETIALIGATADPFLCKRFYQLSPLVERLGFFVSHRLPNGDNLTNWQLELELPGISENEKLSKTQADKMLRKAYQQYRKFLHIKQKEKGIGPPTDETQSEEISKKLQKFNLASKRALTLFPFKTSA
jgi:hypothetical protein